MNGRDYDVTDAYDDRRSCIVIAMALSALSGAVIGYALAMLSNWIARAVTGA